MFHIIISNINLIIKRIFSLQIKVFTSLRILSNTTNPRFFTAVIIIIVVIIIIILNNLLVFLRNNGFMVVKILIVLNITFYVIWYIVIRDILYMISDIVFPPYMLFINIIIFFIWITRRFFLSRFWFVMDFIMNKTFLSLIFIIY